MSRSEVKNYSRGSIVLHWLVAFLVIGMLSGSFFLEDLPEQYQGTAYMLHKSLGITILFLMVLRIIWIAVFGKPKLPSAMPLWQKGLAHLVQYGLIFLLLIMPLSGWIMSVAANRIPTYFGLFSLTLPGIEPNKPLAHFMKESHNLIAWVIIALLVLHIVGSLKHHFIDKDKVFRRMLGKV